MPLKTWTSWQGYVGGGEGIWTLWHGLSKLVLEASRYVGWQLKGPVGLQLASRAKVYCFLTLVLLYGVGGCVVKEDKSTSHLLEAAKQIWL